MSRKEAIEEIKKTTYKDDFKVFMKSLNLSRDDYKTLMEYIDEFPAVQPEPCEDAISRQAAIDALDCINGVEEVLRALPSAQPERKHGKWIGGDGSYICSECNSSPMDFIGTMGSSFDAYVETPMNFCPNCGADMRGGDSK